MDRPDIIQCACGQRMRLPAGAQGRVFKCVACGALIERGGAVVSSVEAASDVSIPDGAEQLLMLFIEMGLVGKDQAQRARNAYRSGKEKIFETLLRLEIINKDTMHTALSREPGTATINLAHFTIDANLKDLLPVTMVFQQWALPIDRLGRSVTVAMVCPVDMEAVAAVEAHTGLRVRPMLCTMDDFLNSLNKHYRLSDEESGVEGLASIALLRREGVVEEQMGAAPKEKAAAADGVPKPLEAAAPALKGRAPSPARLKELREAMTRLERLAIPSRVLNQVDAVVGAQSEGLRQVVCVVGGSPPCAANVLGTANSAAYGLPGSVDSIPMAIALVGEQAVAVLAANAPKVPSGSERQWFHLTRYSRHCAEIAAILALDCGRIVPNVAYCAGLLHGLGSYALGAVAPDEYRMIDPRLLGASRLHVEEQVFGLGHTEASALLCQAWGLPEVLREGLRHYVAPEHADDYRDIACVLFIATCLASPEGEINSERLPECQAAFKFLHIDPNSVVDTLNNASIGAVGV